MVMKKIGMFLCSSFLIANAFSQVKLPVLEKYKLGQDFIAKYSIKMPAYLKNFGGKHASVLPFNLTYNSIIILPQDNMPCWVPDINTVAKMPVQKKMSTYNMTNPMKR